MPQVKLMGMLKLPETKGVLKLLRKLAPESASPETLTLFKTLIDSEPLTNQVRHLQTINTGILHLLCRKKSLHKYITPRLLQDISNDRRNLFSQSAFTMLNETVTTYRRLHGERRDIPVMRNLRQLQNLHTEILTAYAEQQCSNDAKTDWNPGFGG